MSEELERCPFCEVGYPSAVVWTIVQRRLFAYRPEKKCIVRCDNCNAQGPAGNDRAEAVRLWNTRYVVQKEW